MYLFLNIKQGCQWRQNRVPSALSISVLNYEFTIVSKKEFEVGRIVLRKKSISCLVFLTMRYSIIAIVNDYFPGIGGGVSSESSSSNKGARSAIALASVQDFIPFFQTRLSRVSLPSLMNSFSSS